MLKTTYGSALVILPALHLPDCMSQKDKELLKIAGLSVSEVAPILSLSRAAIYLGIGKRKRYFSAPQILAIIQYLRWCDSIRLRPFLKFLEADYTKGMDGIQRQLINPVATGLAQIVHASTQASDIIAVLSEGPEYLKPTAYFVRVIGHLLTEREEDIDLIAPHNLGQWDRVDFESVVGKRCFSSFIYAAPFPVILLKTDHLVRGFLFTELTINELEASEATKLWQVANQFR